MTKPEKAAPAGFGLSDLEHDALTELANIGVGRAATNLSRLVREQVFLSVPRTEVLALSVAAELLSRREPVDLVAVGQEFAGQFSGHALLIFPEANSFELVHAVVGSTVSMEEVADLEQEALTEIGNVILNGCLVTVANTLKSSFRISLPQLMRGSGRRILARDREDRPDDLVLFLTIDFEIRTRNLHGYIALLMDLPSLSALKSLIQQFIAGLGGKDD
ncbi:chemotaxis protein CheX [Arenibaculum sp.]|uniref:chemotaxis protein CheX n=1 Tax=Arenibaculum sp. TaxID=2865862 RepID=UPI002E1277A4|nr:chemotaxis protein CheX [Arenibaculum sp.]